MIRGAADAAERALMVVEAGGSAATLLVVEGGPEGATGRRMLLVRHADGGETLEGHLGHPALDEVAAAAARVALDDPRADSATIDVAWAGGEADADEEPAAAEDAAAPAPTAPAPARVYNEVRRPVRQLVIVGAGHIAQPLSRMGALLGFDVTVVDDRPAFATRERFPDADRLVRVDFSDPFAEVPIHPRVHVLLVTRGHKYDYECLVRLLRMDPLPGYIGMIGSRRRVRATFVQLLEDGIDRARLDLVHAPVGLDIGAETPEEIAVAVAAELVLVHRGGSGGPLKDVERVARRFFDDGAGRKGSP